MTTNVQKLHVQYNLLFLSEAHCARNYHFKPLCFQSFKHVLLKTPIISVSSTRALFKMWVHKLFSRHFWVMGIGTNVLKKKNMDIEDIKVWCGCFLVTNLGLRPPFSPQEYHLPGTYKNAWKLRAIKLKTYAVLFLLVRKCDVTTVTVPTSSLWNVDMT